MAEENIWKKQARMNQSKGENKNQSPRSNAEVCKDANQVNSPINQYLKNTNNSTPSPPWVKNNPPATNTTQPPWVKNNNSPSEGSYSQQALINNRQSRGSQVSSKSRQSNNQPPWVKSNPPATNQPSWVKSQSPVQVPSKVQTTGIQPPWVKNNEQSEIVKPSSSGNQPPWVKSNSPREAATKPSQPSWVKNSTSTDDQPPWTKNNNPDTTNQSTLITNTVNSAGVGTPSIAANGQPAPVVRPAQIETNRPSWVKDSPQKLSEGQNKAPWGRKNEPQSSNKEPGWVKNDSPEVNKNSWKRTQSQQIQKQKKQLEQQIRKQQQEQRQQKRLQKQQRIRQDDQRNIQRELKLMVEEDQQSKKREVFDIKEEERRTRQKREEQERLKQEKEVRRKMQQLEEQIKLKNDEQRQKRQRDIEQSERTKKVPSTKRKNKSVLQTSKLSHISSIKGFQTMNIQGQQDPSVPEKIYHKYLRLINEQTSDNDYKRKIQSQKALYQLQLESRRECESELVNLFASKKITNRKRKYIFSNSMQIQYGLCEGRNGETGLDFMSSQVQELRNRFLQYQLLTKCVFSLIKKKINLHLRVPLINYAEYKGVSFMVEHVCQELVDIIEIQIGLFQQIANQVLIFQKQLELSYQGRSDLRPIGKDQLMVKKISIYGEDYYILYIKNQIPSLKKNNRNESEGNLLAQLAPQFSHLNDLNVLETIIGQNNILPFYQPPLEVTKTTYDQLSKVVSPALKKILHGFCLARAINRVYSSCQGEVEQQSFFQLLLEGNKQMWDMVVAAGSPDREIPSPLSLAYLERLSLVKFNYGPNMFSRKNRQLVRRSKPAVFIQKHDYQLFEFIKNLEKYIEEDKEELVEQSLSYSRQLWQDLSQGGDKKSFSFLKLKSQVSYLLYKEREIQAIQLIQQAKQQCGSLSLESIPIFLLSLKIYVAKDMQVSLLKTLSEILPTLQFYFGQESMLHALVYTAVANYYSKKGEEEQSSRSRKVVTFYQHALNIGLKLYGEKSLEVADLYLNRASAFVNLNNYTHFNKDIQQALKIYKTHSKSASKIAECNHLMGRVRCLEGQINEGIGLMELSSKQWMKMYCYIESLTILFEMLPFLDNRESQLEVKIERIVEICFTYKSVWAFKKIVTLVLDRQLNCYTSLTIQNLQELFHPLDPDDRNNEEVLIDLEEQIKGFTSFIEIVRWALSIIAGKLAARRQVTGDYQKAHRIVGEIFLFYGRSQGMLMDSKDLNSQLL